MTAMLRNSSIAIRDALSPERIIYPDCSNKRDALNSLIDLMAQSPEIPDRAVLADGIFHRESLMSTGIGLGVGIPHVRLPGVNHPIMAVGICQHPLPDYESIDGLPVRVLIMIVAGETQRAEYLTLLSVISSHFKNKQFMESLMEASSASEAYDILVR